MYKLYKLKTLCEIKVKNYTKVCGAKHCINLRETSRARSASTFDGERTQTYVTQKRLSATPLCEVFIRFKII